MADDITFNLPITPEDLGCFDKEAFARRESDLALEIASQFGVPESLLSGSLAANSARAAVLELNARET